MYNISTELIVAILALIGVIFNAIYTYLTAQNLKSIEFKYKIIYDKYQKLNAYIKELNSLTGISVNAVNNTVSVADVMDKFNRIKKLYQDVQPFISNQNSGLLNDLSSQLPSMNDLSLFIASNDHSNEDFENFLRKLFSFEDSFKNLLQQEIKNLSNN